MKEEKTTLNLLLELIGPLVENTIALLKVNGSSYELKNLTAYLNMKIIPLLKKYNHECQLNKHKESKDD